ncbi:MAG: MFS transporter [Chloroflexi bacterium]|nr:MAG: MFS transporter [Chloroflexota bacterium]
MSQTQIVDEAIPSAVAPAPRPRPWTVLSSSPFRKLWIATTLSLFGDFFSYIALAWLVLQLTGSSLALARFSSCRRFRERCSWWSEARWPTASRRA